ncbi:hypothetical protein ACFE04_002748 [Oxalis oulophora]
MKVQLVERSYSFHDNQHKLNRVSFPDGFIFGLGSSAYQIEGAANVDGRRASIWDTFANQHPNGKISRGANPQGLKFYNFLIDELLSYAGNSATEPYIVTHHQLLAHATAVQLYRRKYQARQKGIIGITVNALWMVPKYDTESSREAASRAFDFSIGWILHPITYGDYPDSMRRLVGDRLPKFTKEQAELVKGSVDFFGMNYYTARYASDVTYYSTVDLSYATDSRVNLTTEKDGIPIGEPTGSGWINIYPKGIRDLVLFMKSNYKNPTIFITENGMADRNNRSLPIQDCLNDTLRIKYHHLHLSYLVQAIEKGADVRGYYAWAFMDDFEWEFGYTDRYGFTYIDFTNGLERILKKSAYWLHSFLQPQEYLNSFSESLSIDGLSDANA